MTPLARDRGVGKSLAQFIPLMLVLLLSAALRFYRLDAQSFWNDEGNTARLIERPVRLILEGAAGDVHPPGYYLLLRLWRALAGHSEFALRAYSALCGVLSVAVTAAAVHTLGKPRRRAGLAAWSAAFLVAINPLAVYYSQEARMYAQLGLASALTLWVSMVMVLRQTRRGWKAHLLPTVSLAGCIALGLYTQYTYILALAGLNLAFALYWVLQRPINSASNLGLLLRWVGAHALGGLLFIPWAPNAIGASGWRPPDLSNTRALSAMARTLLGGVTLPASLGALPCIAAGLLLGSAFLISLRAPRASASRYGIWAAAGMALAPPLLIAAAGIYRPAYLKFLISCITPAGGALAAALLTRSPGRLHWRRIAGLLAVASLIPVQAASLHNLYKNPSFARDDYRGIAAQIAEQGRPGDAILLNAPNQWEVFTYYYHGPLPVYPAPYRPDPQEAAGWVASTLSRHLAGRIFVLFWGDQESDPERFIERELAQQAYKAGERWITSVRLVAYGAYPLPMQPAALVNITLEDNIRLKGYVLEGPASPEDVWSPGDIVPLTLFWTAGAPPADHYKVFIHLVDAAGSLVGQTDMEPQAGFRPTGTWQRGETIVDRYGVALPGDLAPGAYTLRAGMYRYSGERLEVVNNGQPAGDFVTLGEITVAAPQ